MPKRAYGGFWCACSKFDRGKKKMTKSAHTIGISNNILSKTCSYLIYPMHYKMWLPFLFSSISSGIVKMAGSLIHTEKSPQTLLSLLPPAQRY
jgi:hypothetical protein